MYGQISDFDVQKVKHASDSQIKGKVGAKVAALFQLFSGSIDASAQRQTVSTKEGQVNSFNKLRQVLTYYQNGGHIADLEECIEAQSSPVGTILYRYNGKFKAVSGWGGDDKVTKFADLEEKKENAISVFHANCIATSGICVLQSRVGRYDLQIACSLKYFSDMGSGRKKAKGKTDYSDEDTFEIRPHSGNFRFFSGEGVSEFEALLFITEQSGKRLFGSPLVLFKNFRPSF